MTAIRAKCPTCGHVDLAANEISLLLHASGDTGMFGFTCPECSGALWELRLLDGDAASRAGAEGALGGAGRSSDTCVELALDYAHAGLFADAATVLKAAGSDPLASYILGWVHAQAGDQDEARRAFQCAAALPTDYCFPNRLEDVLALEAAMRLNPADARAPYYLGDFWYAHRRYAEAIACWEQSRALDGRFATVHRNLGLAHYNKLNDPPRALQSFETAFALNSGDARVLFELDQLYKKLNRPPEQRLTLLEQHVALVEQRDDLTIEQISLLNLLGRPEDAFDLLAGRTFHPWEGGEGKVTGQYVTSLVELARQAMRDLYTGIFYRASTMRRSSSWSGRRYTRTTWAKASCTAPRRTTSSTSWAAPIRGVVTLSAPGRLLHAHPPA